MTRNLRIQECSHHKGSLRYDLTNIELACLDACVRVKAWFKSRECPEAAVGHGSWEFVSQHTVNIALIGHHIGSMEWLIYNRYRK
jgi:hypothetical protein